MITWKRSIKDGWRLTDELADGPRTLHLEGMSCRFYAIGDQYHKQIFGMAELGHDSIVPSFDAAY